MRLDLCDNPGAWTIAAAAQRLPGVRVPGLYIHVPFCFHKCHYCDFYSITRQEPQRMERFVDLVLAEAAAWKSHAGPILRPKTAFIGGGTPTLLPLDAMRRLLRGLRESVDLDQIDEWTVEANPATVTAEYCAMMLEEGVHRISFGAQSFEAAELQVLERHHDPEDVPRSVELARVAGFKRINVDLIYAIPGQDLRSWRQSLDGAVALRTEHLSCYALTYESNTPIAVKKRLGLVRAADDELELEMLREARVRLASAGYLAYEISNYARPGEECRHNLMYWNGGSYIGLGPSAASHVEGWRWKNRPHLGEWERAMEAGRLPAADVEQLTPAQRAGELVMLQLRLREGVGFAEFAAHTGFDARALYDGLLHQLAGAGLIEVDTRGFRLTCRGIDVADAVAAEFLAAPTDR